MENTLKNNKRKFDYNNYKEWDNVAKLAVRSFLESLGCELFPDVESYDADIMVVQPIKSYHEVEVKLGWKEEWPSSWKTCLLYTSPSPRDGLLSRMPSSA